MYTIISKNAVVELRLKTIYLQNAIAKTLEKNEIIVGK